METEFLADGMKGFISNLKHTFEHFKQAVSGADKTYLKCFNCDSFGHNARNCTELKKRTMETESLAD